MDFINFDVMNSEEKQWFASAIAGMILADGHVDNKELESLREAITFLEDPAEINRLVTLVKNKQMPQLMAMRMEGKKAFNILKYLAELSIVDGRLSLTEKDYFFDAGFCLGFPEDLLKKIIRTASKQMEANKPVARMTVGDVTNEVVVTELSETRCTFKFNRAIAPRTRLFLNFYERNTGSKADLYKQPVLGVVKGVSQSAADENTYYVRVDFQVKVNADHGVLQILDPNAFNSYSTEGLEVKNKSLIGRVVSCFVCGKEAVPFYSLRTHAMKIRKNIFGIATYLEPVEGRDFVDYLNVQVGVCPQCLFASESLADFMSDKNPTPEFDAQALFQALSKTVSQRRLSLEDNVSGFFSEHRTSKQAIIAYEYAIEATNHIYKLTEEVEHVRHMAKLIVTQAELYMNLGFVKEAHANLQRAAASMEEVFEKFKGESIYKVALLLGMIKMYFKDNQGLGTYINFLKNVERERRVDRNSPEFRTYKVCFEYLERAFEFRDEIRHDRLKNFHLPGREI